MAEEAEDVDGVEGPIARINAVSDVLAAVDGGLDPLRLVRLRAVVELRRAGWSNDRIADATTLSKSRVRQLGLEAAERDL